MAKMKWTLKFKVFGELIKIAHFENLFEAYEFALKLPGEHRYQIFNFRGLN